MAVGAGSSGREMVSVGGRGDRCQWSKRWTMMVTRRLREKTKNKNMIETVQIILITRAD